MADGLPKRIVSLYYWQKNNLKVKVFIKSAPGVIELPHTESWVGKQ